MLLSDHSFLQYKMLDADGNFTDPLKWWKKNETKYTTVAGLTKEYLATPATSAPSERVWSRVARVLTAKRSRLKEELVSRMMFVQENRKLLHKYFKQIALSQLKKDQLKLIPELK